MTSLRAINASRTVAVGRCIAHYGSIIISPQPLLLVDGRASLPKSYVCLSIKLMLHGIHAS